MPVEDGGELMTQSGPVRDRSTWEGQSCILGAVLFGIEILTILLALVIELFYIQLVTNVF